MIVLPPSRSPIGCFRGVGCGGGNTSVGGLLGGTGECIGKGFIIWTRLVLYCASSMVVVEFFC